MQNQWRDNKGKCGLCGDSYSLKRPRPYESGGKLVKGIITRTYRPGVEIDVVIQIIANHMGTFEFGLCPRNRFNEIGNKINLFQHSFNSNPYFS